MGIITDTLTVDLVAILATILIGITAYCKYALTYWNKTDVPTLPTTVPFGNVKDLFLGYKTFGEQFRDLYFESKRNGYTKHAGIFLGLKPVYMAISPEVIKNILQTNFQYFVNHGTYLNEKDDPLTGHLFNLEDAKWRNMRTKLTPTFTSAKMKMMFQTMVDCTVDLKDIMDQSANHRTPVDIKEVLACFATDIIGSIAFGLECNSFKNPDAEFRKYGRKIFDFTGFERVKLVLLSVLPRSILYAFRFRFTKRDVEDFFMKVIRETVEYRERNNIFRKDFMHLLLQLKNRGKVTDDEKVINEEEVVIDKALTMNELSAQAFVFFLAGFETSSTAMTFALYELATNPDVQEKLRDEINTVLNKHNNQLTYEAIMSMTYMDRVIYETLRKYPPVPLLNRQCTKDYPIPNSSTVIKRGTDVNIPVLGLHMDPKYYPDPTKFDPERFTDENKNSRPTFTWLPFGEGPRVCIGLRFAMLQTKVAITALLRNYQIELSNKTSLPLQLDKTGFVTTAAGGIWLDVEKLS